MVIDSRLAGSYSSALGVKHKTSPSKQSVQNIGYKIILTGCDPLHVEVQEGPNNVGTFPSLMNKRFANPALTSERFEKQSSVKCREHNKRLELNCCGIIVKMNCNHCFFTPSSFGSPCNVDLISQRRKQRLLDMSTTRNNNSSSNK